MMAMLAMMEYTFPLRELLHVISGIVAFAAAVVLQMAVVLTEGLFRRCNWCYS